MDLVILVIASRGKIYDSLVENYWKYFIDYVNNKHKNIKIYLLYGNCNINNISVNKNNILHFKDIKETLIPGILLKTIKGFQYIDNNYDYKFVLRTNLSSFFIIDNLVKLYNNLSENMLYSGVIGNFKNKSKFCSGAAFFLSKDVIKYIILNKHKLRYNIIDDVSIGMLLSTNKSIKFKPLPRFNITDNKSIKNNQKQILLQNIIKNNHYHIRIKNPKNRLIDLDYMKYFTNHLYKK